MASETKFKETEIGMIPEDWNIVKFEEILINGTKNGIYKQKEFHGHGSKIVNMGELFAYSRLYSVPMKRLELTDSEIENFSLKEDDLLFARRSLVAEGAGKCSIVREVKEPTVFESSILRARPNPKKANSLYLYYLFNSKYGLYLLNTIRRQVAVAGITGKDLQNLQIPLPSLPEQKVIANVLSFFDDKIELNNKMNKTLEQLAQTLFKHWFIDFEFPDENGNPYKSSGGRMVDSELGEISEGWEVKQIGNICETFGGGTPKTSEPSYWEGGDVFWATPTDMTSLNSPIIFDTSRKITAKGLQNSSAKLLPAGSILMTSRATLGYFAISKVPISTNQGFISMVCDDRVSNYYLLNTVQNKMDEIENLAGGSTFLEINKTSFRSIKVIFPPKSVMKKFDEIADSIYMNIFQNELETKKLAEIRDSLLPKLMSGKIRVEC